MKPTTENKVSALAARLMKLGDGGYIVSLRIETDEGVFIARLNLWDASMLSKHLMYLCNMGEFGEKGTLIKCGKESAK